MGRRIFVGTFAAGLPMLAGATSVGLAQSSHGAPHVAGNTAVDRELLRQIHAAVDGLRGPDAAAAARHLAATLRLGAAHYEATGADAAFTRALAAATRREGRDAVLTRVTDRQQFAHELKAFGISSLPPLSIDKAEQGRMLDRLAAGGITPVLLALAGHVEEMAGHLERTTGIAAAAAGAGRCVDISKYLQLMEIAAMASCFWNPLACALVSGVYAGTVLGYVGVSWYYGCR